MIEDRTQNKQLWKKDTILRDNGVLTIGIYIIISNAKPIKRYMANAIPIVVIMNYGIVLKSFNLYPTANIQSSIVKKSTQAFYIKGIQLNMLSLSPTEANYSDLFCDHQQAFEKITR